MLRLNIFVRRKKIFFAIHNKSTRNILKKTDAGIRKVLSKTHKAITNFSIMLVNIL